MNIRNAFLSDLDAVSYVESLCFPSAEAAPRECLRERLLVYPEHFWLVFEGGTLVSYVGGPTVDGADLTDDMYENASLYRKNGEWQMIFSVCTHPNFRGKGYAGSALRRAAADCRRHGQKGLVLTCKEKLLPFYSRFGFVNEGLSSSVHGDAQWYQMRLIL